MYSFFDGIIPEVHGTPSDDPFGTGFAGYLLIFHINGLTTEIIMSYEKYDPVYPVIMSKFFFC